MQNRASKRLRRIAIQTAALGFALAIAAPAWAAPPTARSTRPPSGSSGSSGSEASGSATSNTGGRTAVPRGSGSVDSGSSRGRNVRRPPGRRFGGRIGIGIGFGHYWGRYHGHYGHFGYWNYYPYYPWGFAWYPYGPGYRVYGADYGLGAVDLNVRPKKAEVYLDGELVGRAGKFDGFPGHLIVESGRYRIAFYHPGYETVIREVRVPAGVVVRLHLDLEPGEAKPPGQFFAEREPLERRPLRPRPDIRDRDRDRDERWRDRAPGETTGERPAARDEPAALDVRGEPGRCRLAIYPADASVYLDGRFLGSGQEIGRLHSGLLVEPGEHKLEVARPGYATRSLDFTVEAGGEVELEIRLEEAS